MTSRELKKEIRAAEKKARLAQDELIALRVRLVLSQTLRSGAKLKKGESSIVSPPVVSTEGPVAGGKGVGGPAAAVVSSVTENPPSATSRLYQVSRDGFKVGVL